MTSVKASTNPRLIKYREFNPNLDKQYDRRNLERAADALEAAVIKNHNHVGVPSFAGVPILDAKGKMTGLNIFTLAAPLQEMFSREDLRNDLVEAFKASMIDIAAKKARVLDGEKVETPSSSSSLVMFAKPARPIWDLSAKEMDLFFILFKESVAKKDGIKIKRKWPKYEKGILIEHPTALTSFDEFIEEVLPSGEYKGSACAFKPGNLTWRQKLVVAYLFKKNSYDANTYAETVPEGYKNRDYKLEDIITLGKNPAETEPQRRRNRNQNVDDTELSEEEEEDSTDCGDYTSVDNSATDDVPVTTATPGRKRKTVAENVEPAKRTRNDCHEASEVVGEIPAFESTRRMSNNIFDMSHRSGTPDRDDYESDGNLNDSSIAANIVADLANGNDDPTRDFDKEETLEMLTQVDIREALAGDTSVQPVVQICNVAKLPAAACFRAVAHNARFATEQVTFSANLNKQVQAQLSNKFNVIRITKFKVCNNAFLFIQEFSLVKEHNVIIGNPYYLTAEDYSQIRRSQPKPRLPASPSVVQRRLTSKFVDNVNLQTFTPKQLRHKLKF